ncbi:MAG: TrkA C-terminal domain-containing protein [Candidatus Aminicenantes bacterium]
MSSFYFLLPTLLAVLISFLFVRASAIALMMTGMDKRRARFQALSAFSGTGFTTKEAEIVIHHPVRRKIVTWLMIMGNAGIVTVIVTATSSMATSHGYQLPINVFVIVIGVYIIYRVATHKGFLKRWDRFIERKLIKSPTFDEAPAEDLLHFLEGYGLIRRVIPETSPLAGRSLEECRVSEQGLLVLGIERGKKWIPTPKASEKLEVGDGMVVYGPLKVLKDLLKGELKFKSDS